MGSSKGRASRERRAHRNASVLRHQAGETHHVVAERGNKTIVIEERREMSMIRMPEPFPGDRDTKADASPFSHLTPTSEQRAYFNRHLIGAIRGIAFVIMAGLILVLVLGVGILLVARGG